MDIVRELRATYLTTRLQSDCFSADNLRLTNKKFCRAVRCGKIPLCTRQSFSQGKKSPRLLKLTCFSKQTILVAYATIKGMMCNSTTFPDDIVLRMITSSWSVSTVTFASKGRAD